MADVYLARDTHLGREVAIKILYKRYARDEEFVARFRREAQSAAALQHQGCRFIWAAFSGHQKLIPHLVDIIFQRLVIAGIKSPQAD